MSDEAKLKFLIDIADQQVDQRLLEHHKDYFEAFIEMLKDCEARIKTGVEADITKFKAGLKNLKIEGEDKIKEHVAKFIG